MTGRYIYMLLIILCLLTNGCHRTPYHRLEELPAGVLKIEFDWDGYTDIPPGMNLVFYPVGDDADVRPITMQLQYDGGEVSLPIGSYNAVVYNDYTYDILYRGMDNFFSAEAFVQENNRQPLASRLPGTKNMAMPDVFYVSQIRNLQVKPYEKDRTIVVRPELMTLTLHVHVRGKGLENIKKAEGGISGIAGSVMLSTGLSAETTPSNILFPYEVHPDRLYATTRVFLMADRLAVRYTLELAFLLQNNSISMGKYSYDVTDQIVVPLQENGGRIPPEGIHIHIDDIVIDEVAGGGGFDAVIDNWGNQVDIELK